MRPLAGDNCTDTVAQLFEKFNLDLRKEYDYKLHDNLSRLCSVAYKKDADDLFSGPLVWIGVYIAIGSALCILKLVVADLLSDASRARQIPYKWFSLNAATLTVLGIAMKLPLDMTGSMPGLLDQTTKLGSLVFMCTMLANLIPNLASMDVKTLKSNLVALAILVITIIVNILVEIFTGVIGDRVLDKLGSKSPSIQYMMSRKMPYGMDNYFVNMAIAYTVWLFFLLTASVSAAVAIPSMKKVLESKYQVRRKALSEEPTTLVELEKHVTRYWIMAKTGSPQLVLTASPLIVASGAICIASTITYAELIRRLINSIVASEKPLSDYLGSDYEWSMLFILITQGIGTIVGDITLARIYVNITRIKLNSYYSLRVEKFWYVILFEWQGRHIAFPKGGRKRRTYVHTVKNSFLNLWIPIQVFVIQICKIIGLIPFIITQVIRMIWCRHVASREDHEDLIKNVLQVEDKVKNDEYALHFLLKIRDGLVKKAKKKDTSNLLELLRKSNGFKAEGQKFAIDQVQIPPSVMLKSWSLPVITLTCIAMVVPDSQDQINRLIKSVDQALAYTHHVEEVFNSAHEYTNMGKKTMDFWYEVTDECRWLETSLKRDAFQGKTPTQILKWFDDKAEEAIGTSKSTVVVVEVEENHPDRKLMICNSMRSISRSILSKYENRSQLSTKVDFFQLLSSMIADILFACFSNIPQAITKKCQEKEIEKREASVEDAVKILARTTKILEMFGTPKLPVLDRDKMASIHEWRHPLTQPPTDPELSAV